MNNETKKLMEKAVETKYEYESLFINENYIAGLKTTGQFKKPTFIVDYDFETFFVDVKYAVKAEVTDVNEKIKYNKVGYIVKVRDNHPLLSKKFSLGFVDKINSMNPKEKTAVKCLG